MSRNGVPKKPDDVEGQISVLWDFMTNHVWSRLKWQDVKMNFVLVFLGLILALLAISITQ